MTELIVAFRNIRNALKHFCLMCPCQILSWASLNLIYRFRPRSLDHIFKYCLPTCIGITKVLLRFKLQTYSSVSPFCLHIHIFLRMHSSWYQVSGCYISWVQFDPRLRWPTLPTFKYTRFSSNIRPTQYFYNSFTVKKEYQQDATI